MSRCRNQILFIAYCEWCAVESGIAAKVNGLTLAQCFGTIFDYLKGLEKYFQLMTVCQFLKLTHLATNMESNPRNSTEQHLTVFSLCGYEYRHFTNCSMRRAEAGWLHLKFCASVGAQFLSLSQQSFLLCDFAEFHLKDHTQTRCPFISFCWNPSPATRGTATGHVSPN